MYLYVKALHIIFVVTWFAGLFYVVRLLIYHREAQEKYEGEKRTILEEQYTIMTRRLWRIITVPSSLLALGFGVGMLYLNSNLLSTGWMHIKLAFVLGLFAYMFQTSYLIQKLKKGMHVMGSNRLRAYNELPTLALFAVVFLAVLKNEVSWLYGTLGLILLSLLLFLSVRIYKRWRSKNNA